MTGAKAIKSLAVGSPALAEAEVHAMKEKHQADRCLKYRIRIRGLPLGIFRVIQRRLNGGPRSGPRWLSSPMSRDSFNNFDQIAKTATSYRHGDNRAIHHSQMGRVGERPQPIWALRRMARLEGVSP